MKKSTLTAVVIVIVLVIGGIVWYSHSGSTGSQSADSGAQGTTPVVASTEATKVSGDMTQYKNDELGFSVNYPTAWEREDSNAGVTFVIPIDKSQVSTIATLQANIQVVPGTCAFPPVTSIKDRGTVTVGSNTMNTVSMSNSVKGYDYFDRMYSLQSGKICYMFHFTSVTQPTSAKSLTGSQATQAQNNNKAIVTSADAQFTSMVKTFAFVTLPAGEDETQAAPAKK